ncbi:hypothetical protein FIBSPDRAFT_312335 [Athelia psychrophila]|uniref:Uncharacterized protein n=1 Tax=Athelia psychrophila TaxID=1759441 RepID=A0A166WDB3_9AGAM|nr:hypothetical protein FIBSPDRAFT_462249 [Fibularhizoctonia sp. CBS 109695]KZP33640.1 hypothetical protein FIBSPDRAFT_312335 [Fibularhizoctonia sp. CBS 109695]
MMSVRHRGFEGQTDLNHRGFEAHFGGFFRVVRRGSFRGPFELCARPTRGSACLIRIIGPSRSTLTDLESRQTGRLIRLFAERGTVTVWPIGLPMVTQCASRQRISGKPREAIKE